MLLEKRLPDLKTEERLDCDMQDEIDSQMEYLKKYTSNINSFIGHKRAKEVKKAMINFLIEQI